jgi:hypothetical protein
LPWAPTAIEPDAAAVPVSVTLGEDAPDVVSVFCALVCDELEALQPISGKNNGR